MNKYFLTTSRDGIHRLRYADVSRDSRIALQAYLQEMESISISNYNRNEQFAYWVNLYNAATVELILEQYPVKSIRDIGISGPVFNRHPWDAKLLQVEDEKSSLNDIEHRMLRPIWPDYRRDR